MRRSLHIRKEPNLQKVIIASALLHLLFITFIVTPIKTREREFKSYFVSLVSPVEVSRKVTKETKSYTVVRKRKRRVIPKKKIVVPKESPKKVEKVKKVVPKPKTDMSLESVDRVAREIERLRAIKALSEKIKKKQRAHEIEVVRKRILEGIPKEAGVLGKGVIEDLDSYYALITRKIWSQWVYPDFEATGLEVIISIKIDRDGKIVSHEIEKSSGNVLFDRSAIKALSKASPLPPPPVEMEIGVRFYL
jgi:colicin import membrane protein